MNLEYDDLMDILDDLFDKIKREAILQNRTGDIEIFFEKYGIEQFKKSKLVFNENAKILIIGLNNGSIKSKDINGIFKTARLLNRFDVISYDEATNFDIRKLENSSAYSDVFIGTVPHSIKGMGDSSSAILTLQKGSEVIYPKIHVLRKENGELGITKSNLKEAIINSALYKFISNI